MEFFNRFNKSTKKESGATIIAKGTNIMGAISTDGRIHIDGKFEGAILEADVISIGVTGKIIGEIKTNTIIISGLIDGKVDCNEIQILKTGKVIGNVKYNNLTIEINGQFEGEGIRKGSKFISDYKNIEKNIINMMDQSDIKKINSSQILSSYPKKPMTSSTQIRNGKSTTNSTKI